jgi:hypothetical protein
MVALHIAEYKSIISDLRSEIDSLKTQLHKNVSPVVPGIVDNADCRCSCGKAQDEEEMKRLQAEIFENFQERIQLRRALLELEEQNALNALEIKRRQAEVLLWKKQEESSRAEYINRPQSAVPPHIRKQFKDIQLLKASTDKNNMRKELMLLQLQENMTRGKLIRASVDARIKFQDKRDFLELLIKNHILEQTNVELELQLQIQEKTIGDLQNLVLAQKKLLEEHGVDDGTSLWSKVENLMPPIEDNIYEDIEDITEEGLQLQGYDISGPMDEEEEQPFDGDEDFETSELLLATSKVSADIEKPEQSVNMGLMLQGKSLPVVKKQEEESKVKYEAPRAEPTLPPAPSAPSIGLIVNGKTIDDGLDIKGTAAKMQKPIKKKPGVEAHRKKK